MLSKFITSGQKVELKALVRANGGKSDEKKIYVSKVITVLSDDSMEIMMPMEQTKLVLLPVDSEYEMVFYGASSLYQCLGRIADRYKSNNVYILQIELTSNLRKYQRREYYRYSCALEMCSRNLDDEEVQAVAESDESSDTMEFHVGLPLKHSVIVDISGGGLRFMSTERYEPDSLIYCSYNLLKDGSKKNYEVVGRVLAAKEVEHRPGIFEHRVQYYNIDMNTREEIIKFIFEEERKNRGKGR